VAVLSTIGELRDDAAAALVPRDLYPPDGTSDWILADDEWMPLADSARTATLTVRGDEFEWRDPFGTTHEATLSGGEARLRRTIVPGDRSMSIFEPPLLLVSPDAPRADGAALESETPMRVDWIDGGERDRGAGVRSSRILGRARVRTPAGAADATVVENTFEARLKLARARRVTTLWIVPGQGPVAERWTQTIFVFGIPAGTTRGAAVRSAPRLAGSGART
jgi:hypothetical protein